MELRWARVCLTSSPRIALVSGRGGALEGPFGHWRSWCGIEWRQGEGIAVARDFIHHFASDMVVRVEVKRNWTMGTDRETRILGSAVVQLNNVRSQD